MKHSELKLKDRSSGMTTLAWHDACKKEAEESMAEHEVAGIDPQKLVVLETIEDKRVAEYIAEQLRQSVVKLADRVEQDYVADWKAGVAERNGEIQNAWGDVVQAEDVKTVRQIDDLYVKFPTEDEDEDEATVAVAVVEEPVLVEDADGIPAHLLDVPPHLWPTYGGIERNSMPNPNRLPDWTAEAPPQAHRRVRTEPRAKHVQSAFNKTFTRDNPKRPGMNLPIKRAESKNPEGLTGRQLKKARKALQREQKAVDLARTEMFEKVSEGVE